MNTKRKLSLRRESVLMAMLLWIFVGALWAVSQFAVSLTLDQMSLRAVTPKADALSKASEQAAWPAGVWYEKRQQALYASGLEKAERNSALPPEVRGEAADLLALQRSPAEEIEKETVQTKIYDFLSAHKLVPEISKFEEYAIYLAACVMWGSFITVTGILITLVALILRGGGPEPESLTEPDGDA